MSYKIALSSSRDYTKILNVWKNSARSSLYFLSEEDALYYKGLIPSYFPQVELYIVKREEWNSRIYETK